MLLLEVVLYPRNEVIFKGTLDHLVEEVTRKQFMNVSAREVACEWLKMVENFSRTERGN